MAISTYQTYLMYKNSSSYEKVVDIKSFGDLGGTPELLDTTTLSDKAKTSILGIQGQEAIEFEANYTKTDFSTVKALEGTEHDFAIYMGASAEGTPDGSKGKFTFKGNLSVFVKGGGVNEVTGMTISIAPSTPIDFA